MSTFGKQKYIFSRSSFGASVTERDNKFISLMEETDDTLWEDQTLAIDYKPGWALVSSLDGFVIEDEEATDKLAAIMGLYWSVRGSGTTKTAEYVNTFVGSSGYASGEYAHLTYGTINFIESITYEEPSIADDGWAWDQVVKMPLNCDAITNYRALMGQADRVTDQMVAEFRLVADIYNTVSWIPDTNPIHRILDTCMTLPLSDLEMSFMNTDVTTDYATIDSEYNFWSRAYERVLEGTNAVSGDTESHSAPHETYLPNCALQLCADTMEEGDTTRNTINQCNTYYMFSGQSGCIDQGQSDSQMNSLMETSTGSSAFWNTAFPKRLEAVLADTVTDVNHMSAAYMNTAITKFKNIIIDAEHVNAVGDPEYKRENYPFYVDIQFKTDISTSISDALVECNLMDEFMLWIADRTNAGSPTSRVYYEATSKWDFEETDNASGIELAGDRLTVFKTERTTLEMDEFITWLGAVQGTSSDFHYFSTSPSDSSEALSSCDYMKNKLYAMIFEGKLQTVADQWGHSSMEDCWDSTPSYSDTVAYRIAKYDEAGTTLIQNIYLPNTSELDLMQYIDTQVRYGQKYTYRIYAYQAANVTEYKRTSTELAFAGPDGAAPAAYTSYISPASITTGPATSYLPDGTSLADLAPYLEMEYRFRNKISIIEVPLYAQKVKILDSAPLPPEAYIIPLKDSTEQIHIMLNNRTGRQWATPINILGDSDADMHTAQAEAQRLVPGDEMLFESEERPDTFQVFRMETQPTDWTDFEPYLHLQLQPSLTPVDEMIRKPQASYGTNLYSHAVAVWDTLEANTKYYYTFRTIDVHGFISNPTEIYQVELVNNDGTTYLLVEAVDFAPKVPKQKERTFTRYLKVAPRITQVIIDQSIDGTRGEFAPDLSGWDAIDNNMDLGVQDQTVWGKKFRFTIRSKKTGREIHMYAEFMKTHTETARELEYKQSTEEG